MTRKDLSERVATKLSLKAKDVDEIMVATIREIKESVAEDEAVVLTGFGTFKRNFRNARIARNPQTGADMEVPASYAPSFVSSKPFKEMVKQKGGGE